MNLDLVVGMANLAFRAMILVNETNAGNCVEARSELVEFFVDGLCLCRKLTELLPSVVKPVDARRSCDIGTVGVRNFSNHGLPRFRVGNDNVKIAVRLGLVSLDLASDPVDL